MRCVNSFPRDQEEPKKMREFPISSYSFPSPKSLSSFSPSLPFSSSFYSFPRIQCCGLQACLYFLFFLFLAVNTPGYTTSASLDPPPLQRSPFFRSKIPILNRLRIALLRRSSPFSSTSSSAGLSHSGGSSSFSSSPSVSVNQIRKPLHDHREYRYVELANGMKVLLIRDSRCDEASSSIRVGVGSASDPANIPGLAHFTEHMLFQGSKNYPGCHDFFDFVHEHGGLSNAFTSKFSTVFSFSIGPAFLNEALQRMADAFTNPLFKDTQFSKEVDAVHSEYTVDLTDDTHRVFHLVRQTSHGGPLSHFTVGNHESLLINTKRQGIDPLQAMKDFHSQWYSSNLMSLAILGRESLDELEAMARQHFSSVKNKNLQPPVFEECSDTFIPLDPKELGTQTFAVPLADIHDVHFVFYLPPQFREWRSKPLHWISSLLQSQGPSSLISRLRRLGLATALSAAYWSPELCTVFQIGVSLTEKGRSKESIYRIGELLFIYLRGMSSSRPERWRFAEMRHMMDLGFAYADMPRPFDLTVATVD
ncbi:rhoptry metalloprotease toxolysin tln1, partial [Cystoisospora suis]